MTTKKTTIADKSIFVLHKYLHLGPGKNPSTTSDPINLAPPRAKPNSSIHTLSDKIPRPWEGPHELLVSPYKWAYILVTVKVANTQFFSKTGILFTRKSMHLFSKMHKSIRWEYCFSCVQLYIYACLYVCIYTCRCICTYSSFCRGRAVGICRVAQYETRESEFMRRPIKWNWQRRRRRGGRSTWMSYLYIFTRKGGADIGEKRKERKRKCGKW